MTKRFLTILTLTGLFFLLVQAWFFNPKSTLIAFSPEIRASFIAPTVWQIESTEPIEDLSLFSLESLPEHKIVALSPKTYAIHFNQTETGWFGWVWIKAKGKQLNHQKKTFLALANPNSAKLAIISFSPTASSKLKKEMEIQVQKSGSLNGIRLEIEQPRAHTATFYLHDLWVKEGGVYSLVFDDAQEKLTVKENQILIPTKLSDSAGVLSLVKMPAHKIQDMIIYRRELSKSQEGWGTKAFREKIERLIKRTGFPYPRENTAGHILLIKGIGSRQTIFRKNLNTPFTQENAQSVPRRTY